MTAATSIICDTSGLLAAIDAADPDHAACAEVLGTSAGRFVLSPLVVAELDHLLRSRVGTEAARTFADDVAAGAYVVAPFSERDAGRCVELDRRYHGLGLGLTDAHLVVLADAHRTEVMFSLNERHLRAVRPLRGRGAFKLLPFDR